MEVGEMIGIPTKQRERIMQDILFLSSPEVGGRLSGTEGAHKAAIFLATSLHEAGYAPAGEHGYFTPVDVPAARLTGPARLKIGAHELRHRIDFAEWAEYSSGGNVSGQVMTVRDRDDILPEQLTGKIVLIPELPQDFDRKGTIESAASLGVAALLIESGEPQWFHKTVFGYAKNNILVIRLRRSVAQKYADQQELMVRLELPLVTSRLSCQNVLGLLPGSDTTRTLLLCAHYDHLGDDPDGLRFPGTIDNASGVAVMLEVARMLARQENRLPFNVLVAFVTGEESGLWGARHLVSHPPLPISAAINLDCLGFEPELAALRVSHKNPGHWIADAAASVIKDQGIDVRWIAGGDDSVAFIEKGIPTIGLGQKPTTPTSTPIHSMEDNPDHLHEKPLMQGLAILRDIIGQLAKMDSWNNTTNETG
jgi:hypothetical protein